MISCITRQAVELVTKEKGIGYEKVAAKALLCAFA